MRKIPLQRILALFFLLGVTHVPRTYSQQPFLTDNADVADRHHWHLESNNEFDALPASSFPNLRQDTHTVKFSFGAFRDCEIGMDFPLITIFNSTSSGLGTPIGFGGCGLLHQIQFPEGAGRLEMAGVHGELEH